MLRSGHGAPLDLLVTVLGLLGLPGTRPARAGRRRGGHRRRAVAARHPRLRPADGGGGRPPVRDRERPRRSPVSASVVVLDYGSGNIRSAVRALEHVGADVTLTADPEAALAADGLFVPGVGNFHACMAGLAAADGPRIIDLRLAGGRPVLGVCVGHAGDVRGVDRAERVAGAPVSGSGRAPSRGCSRRSCRTWAGRRSRCRSGRCCSPASSGERFYFVHSYAAHPWELAHARRSLRGRRAPGHLGHPRRAVRGRRRERARCRRPSSTPRSPARPGWPSSRTGSAPSDPVHCRARATAQQWLRSRRVLRVSRRRTASARWIDRGDRRHAGDAVPGPGARLAAAPGRLVSDPSRVLEVAAPATT